MCREQWIRAKYERKEFTSEAKSEDIDYMKGIKKGFLFKKKKVDLVWQSRFFVLDAKCLSYFRKITVRFDLSYMYKPIRDQVAF